MMLGTSQHLAFFTLSSIFQSAAYSSGCCFWMWLLKLAGICLEFHLLYMYYKCFYSLRYHSQSVSTQCLSSWWPEILIISPLLRTDSLTSECASEGGSSPVILTLRRKDWLILKAPHWKEWFGWWGGTEQQKQLTSSMHEVENEVEMKCGGTLRMRSYAMTIWTSFLGHS